jgi:hypothetical protein
MQYIENGNIGRFRKFWKNLVKGSNTFTVKCDCYGEKMTGKVNIELHCDLDVSGQKEMAYFLFC